MGRSKGERELTRFVALLRGINVGGANRLPMQFLHAAFVAAGAARVATFIQSGNVVFDAPAGAAEAIGEHVAQTVAKSFGFAAPIVMRDAPRWRALIAANPFLARGEDCSRLHVAVLSAPPAPERLVRLDPNRSPPDAYAVGEACLYLHLPNGVARSRMTNAWLDSNLGVVATLRNWATVTRLADML